MSLKSLEEWMNPFHFWKDSTQNACLQNIWITGKIYFTFGKIQFEVHVFAKSLD